MVFTAVISILVGAALGLRFNVLIVVPAIILVLGGTAAVGIAHADHMGSAVLIAASICTALQVGYLIGGFARVAVNSVGASTRSTAAADYRSTFSTFGNEWKWWVRTAIMSESSTTPKAPSALS
jgi:hypothetical protein